jgi:hypothetical protein
MMSKMESVSADMRNLHPENSKGNYFYLEYFIVRKKNFNAYFKNFKCRAHNAMHKKI